jgi:hypothetical protein
MRACVLAATCLSLVAAGCGGDKRSDARPALFGGGKPLEVEVGRNVARLPGLSSGDVAAAAVLSAYPGGPARPSGWILVPGGDWRTAVLAAQFAAKPVAAGLLPIRRDFVPTGPADVLRRVRTSGFPNAHGLRAVVLGKAGTDVFVDLQDLGLKLTQLRDADPARLSGKLVPFRGGWAHSYSSNVVVVSSDAPDYALPAAAWSAYSGDTVAFVSRNSVPKATAALLVQRQKLTLEKPSMYVVGPRGVVSDAVLAKLRAYGRVTRIGGADPQSAAVALARFKDRRTGFGWGLTKGAAAVSVVNPNDWENGIAALTYAATGPQAPLLLTTSFGRLPRAAESYLTSLRGRVPGQGFVFGDDRGIPSETVGRLDALLAPRD